MNNVILQLNNISKSFSGVQALQDVSLTIRRGEIHCLAGENGSGKSTLIKIIAGVVLPDSGEIIINGQTVRRLQPIDAIRAGIQIIYQDFALFPNLTVAENIALNHELAQNKRFVNWGEVRQVAQTALDQIKVRIDLDTTVDRISVAEKQLVAISRALLQQARLLILDEPTTALTHREVESLFQIIKGLQPRGIATLFVSHKLNEVFAISERISIIRNGRKVVDTAAQSYDQSEFVYSMTGRRFDEQRYNYQAAAADGPPLLRVERLSAPESFADISFELRAGEILGITGLLGSGRTELALALFGIRPATAGTISVHGKAARIASVQDAIRYGIGYVPEDRLTEGLFLSQSIARNIVVRTLDQLGGAPRLLSMSRLRQSVATWVQQLAIKTSSPELPVRTLSGGNQQRVVLAKWLAGAPRVLILNGPTVGVDVGSKHELHEIIKGLARDGMGLIVISDDIPELLQVCNRILLMRKGRLAEAFDRSHVTELELTAKLIEA
ncbi:MAG: sugar ABC transporter ATP-binding protein [Chloroflexales bacterium]|nr:sugar ABC transporter ATP-binding protein [Chloroflexales bacterium]